MNERRSTMDMVCEALDARGHRYDVRADSSVIRTGFQGRNSRFNVLITAQGEDTRLAVLVHMAPIVPEDRRREMAELVVRANDGLALGRFDLDMSDGTMAYYASSFSSGPLPPPLWLRCAQMVAARAQCALAASCKLLAEISQPFIFQYGPGAGADYR